MASTKHTKRSKGEEILAQSESGDNKGLLYGTEPDENGQCKYCCCPGDNDCYAAGCAGC